MFFAETNVEQKTASNQLNVTEWSFLATEQQKSRLRRIGIIFFRSKLTSVNERNQHFRFLSVVEIIISESFYQSFFFHSNPKSERYKDRNENDKQ